MNYDPINIGYAIIVVIFLTFAVIIYFGTAISLAKPSPNNCNKYVPEKITIVIDNPKHAELISVVLNKLIIIPTIVRDTNDINSDRFGHTVYWSINKKGKHILRVDNRGGLFGGRDITLSSKSKGTSLIITIPIEPKIYSWDMEFLICKPATISV